jgi:uncharacterized protein (DUF1330 family)
VTAPFVAEGDARTMNAIILFPSREVVLALCHDLEHQEAKRIRQPTTTNVTMLLVEGLRPPR